VREAAERLSVITRIRAKIGPDVESLDQLIAHGPLVRVEFDDG
jgi:hypothetical protein